MPSDLLAELPVPLSDQIAAVQREIAMRQRVYPRWVAAGKMTQAKAEAETRGMQAVLDTLNQAEWALRAATGPQGQPIRTLDANDPLAGLVPADLTEARRMMARKDGCAAGLQRRFIWDQQRAIDVAAALRDEQAAAQFEGKAA
ncbi:hypothetical protein [Falsiroseomonas sp.]|uniref:hypothetical protein n=1 Tax=Falsiroseomonas sp. TaxID=2870721 RepID=UPI0027366A61|nr:hypothetical protein [Falsiroseomonas sp.]MDP3417899.1 hypothetical protein [Falsiroseomonas sp.]